MKACCTAIHNAAALGAHVPHAKLCMLQAMGFVLDPSSLEAAVSLLALDQPGSSLASAAALSGQATQQPAADPELHAAAAQHIACLQGMLCGSLAQPSFSRSGAPQASTQAVHAADQLAADEQRFTYAPEMQVVGCAAAHSRGPAGLTLSLHKADRGCMVARLSQRSVLGSMSQTLALLQQAAADSAVRQVSD